ncbi:hypothetical protein PMAYCL1PPCAC_20826 [Pristionchus mayeri]|uniref:Uncharacterized protein n=1 Tax=Pristionchus mayeri TaxID=1317129 RepID=A0AAN5CTL8_9BILA|nr:hypothetical protein PMAYCL1PPCAC_20826 [Pristionchus mayeri]
MTCIPTNRLWILLAQDTLRSHHWVSQSPKWPVSTPNDYEVRNFALKIKPVSFTKTNSIDHASATE